jgi:hypothetical protein
LAHSLVEHQPEQGFQFADAIRQLLEVGRLGFSGCCHPSVFESAQISSARLYDAPGNANYSRAAWDGVHDYGAGADFNIVPERDATKHSRPGADDNAVAESWMPFPALVARAAERDTLVQDHVVPNFGRFANDYSETMIDEQPFADYGPWMDLNAGQKTSQLRDDAGDQVHSPAIEPVRDTVKQNSVQARVTKQDFQGILGGWIFALDGAHVVA